MINYTLLKFPKRGQIKLSRYFYRKFKLTIHELDSWLCKACDRLLPLTVHHLEKRSHLRKDVRENVVSLCLGCHQKAERKEIGFEWVNEAERRVRVIFLHGAPTNGYGARAEDLNAA